jgi:fermentation-respiration switch protein FrsA (DUF1100 family)
MVSEGKNIYGYFVQSNGTHPHVTVLYNHGRRDNLEYYWDRVELLYKMGFNVFIYDYEGFGMSEGETSESAIYSDAETALAYICSRSDVDVSQIVIYGFSLGCVAAINLASTTFTPLALVLEAPFASSTTLVQSGTLLDIPSSYVMRGEYNNAEKIKSVRAPLLIMHGESDTFIDIDKNSQVIYDNANKPKVFMQTILIFQKRWMNKRIFLLYLTSFSIRHIEQGVDAKKVNRIF